MKSLCKRIHEKNAVLENIAAPVEHIKKVVREQKCVELECEMIIVDK